MGFVLDYERTLYFELNLDRYTRMKQHAIYFLLVSLLSVSATAVAEKIYKHVEPDGTVSFSSSPPAPGAKPADLPEINRGEMTIAGKPLETCARHGGINCQAGPDTDGSVLCFDGYEHASARFRFSCSSTQLEIAEIGDLSDEGIFSVMVRNSKSVAAEAPELYLRQQQGDEITLIGPAEIEAFGVGEFVLDIKDAGRIEEKPRSQDFRLLCKNCSG